MLIGIPKEIQPDERRVAIVPRGVEALKKLGFDVLVESGAGLHADYKTMPSKISPSARKVL